jgi:hypothetical protein
MITNAKVLIKMFIVAMCFDFSPPHFSFHWQRDIRIKEPNLYFNWQRDIRVKEPNNQVCAFLLL